MHQRPLIRQTYRLIGAAGLGIAALLFGSGPLHSPAVHAAGTTPPTRPGAPPGGPPSGAPPGAAAPGMSSVSGSITSVSGSVLTIKTSQGTQKVRLTSSTRFTVKGKPTTSKPTFHHGEHVQILAAKSRNALQARFVQVG